MSSHRRGSHRRKRAVGDGVLGLLNPLLRYSPGREAYVLRGIGRHYGPVLVRDDQPGAAPAGEVEPEAEAAGRFQRSSEDDRDGGQVRH